MEYHRKIESVVFVHGAFGGRHHWKQVADAVGGELGIPTFRVALTGLGERHHLVNKSVDLETHINDVVNLIEFEELKKVCMIGHSYGGVLLSAVSDRLPDRISRRVFLDAYLLEDGENFFSQHPELEADWKSRAENDGDGWLIPPHWPNPHRDAPHPIATLTARVTLKNQASAAIESDYWLFTDGGTVEDDSLKCFYDRAKQREWRTRVFSWDHNPHRNAPEELSKELIGGLQSNC